MLRLLVLSIALCACKGEYGPAPRSAADVDRGEVNGRMFDFVANKPEGDDWQIRIRDNSMSVGYGKAGAAERFKPVALDRAETAHVWRLIDALDLDNREPGERDDDDGYVQLRLRVPGGDGAHEAVVVYVSRMTEDDDVLELATYLRELVGKHHKETPNF